MSSSLVLNSRVLTLTSEKPIVLRLLLMAPGSHHGLDKKGGGKKDGTASWTDGIQPGLVQQVNPVRPPLRRTR